MNSDELELTSYIVDNFRYLMTGAEKAALAAIVVDVEHRDGSITKNSIISHLHESQKKAVEELLKDGMQNLRRRVRDRLMREHSEEVFANKCPRCKRLPRTPRAKQCRFCQHGWR